MTSQKQNVHEIYDAIVDWFDEHRTKDLSLEKKYLEYLVSHLPIKASVLDIGCGTGIPISQFFINQGYRVTGIDASKEMIKRCQLHFPQGTWLREDMGTLHLKEKFDLVIAWHSLFHLPQEDQESTLILLASHVKDNGFLVFTSGDKHSEVWSNNGGYDLFHASLEPVEYQHILESCGLTLCFHKMNDPACGGASVWVAKNAKSLNRETDSESL